MCSANQPSFWPGAGDAQGEALLAEARCRRTPDPTDQIVLSWGKWYETALFVDVRFGVKTAGEVRRISQGLPRRSTHAGHDPHVENHIPAVGDLHADFGEGRSHGPHHEGESRRASGLSWRRRRSRRAFDKPHRGAIHCWWAGFPFVGEQINVSCSVRYVVGVADQMEVQDPGGLRNSNASIPRRPGTLTRRSFRPRTHVTSGSDPAATGERIPHPAKDGSGWLHFQDVRMPCESLVIPSSGMASHNRNA